MYNFYIRRSIHIYLGIHIQYLEFHWYRLKKEYLDRAYKLLQLWWTVTYHKRNSIGFNRIYSLLNKYKFLFLICCSIWTLIHSNIHKKEDFMDQLKKFPMNQLNHSKNINELLYWKKPMHHIHNFLADLKSKDTHSNNPPIKLH